MERKKVCTIDKARRHAVDSEVWVLDELRLRPFARLDAVVGFDMAVD